MAQTPEELAEQWIGLRMAHEAVMVDDAQAVLKAAREQTTAHYKEMGLDAQPEDTGMVHVGPVTNNYTAQAAPTPAPAAAKGLSTLAKTGIAAALLGSGAGIPLAISALWPDKSKPAVEQVFDPSKWEIVIPQAAK